MRHEVSDQLGALPAVALFFFRCFFSTGFLCPVEGGQVDRLIAQNAAPIRSLIQDTGEVLALFQPKDVDPVEVEDIAANACFVVEPLATVCPLHLHGLGIIGPRSPLP